MKHTIKIDTGKAIVIRPNPKGRGVQLSLELFGAPMAATVLTPEQCAVMFLSIQICAEKAEEQA
jgi:hypothetical protein